MGLLQNPNTKACHNCKQSQYCPAQECWFWDSTCIDLYVHVDQPVDLWLSWWYLTPICISSNHFWLQKLPLANPGTLNYWNAPWKDLTGCFAESPSDAHLTITTYIPIFLIRVLDTILLAAATLGSDSSPIGVIKLLKVLPREATTHDEQHTPTLASMLKLEHKIA